MTQDDSSRTEPEIEALPKWVWEARAWAQSQGPPLGTIETIDDDSRRRAVAAVTSFRCLSLCRPLRGRASTSPEPPPWRVDNRVHQNGPFTSVFDDLVIACHGLEITHADALNHFGIQNTWYRGASEVAAEGPSMLELGAVPVVTRAIFLDVAESRPVGWVATEQPVTADDLDAALARAGCPILPGDALVIHMGRDRFEADGGRYQSVADSPQGRPGIAESGARWICDHRPSLVAWDMLDAHGAPGLSLSVHVLTWAIGLMLVDNCSLDAASRAFSAKYPRTCMAVVAPLPIAGTTGSAVNPILVL